MLFEEGIEPDEDLRCLVGVAAGADLEVRDWRLNIEIVEKYLRHQR